MKVLNIEIKAKCEYPDKIKAFLEAKAADFKGVDHQIDTYFKAKSGRLKLREGNIETNLIYYERSNEAGPKRSDVILHRPSESSSLKEILVATLGELVVVDKKRAIYFIDNVKFHIDDVKGLGAFVEIEAIDKDGSIGEEKLNEQCATYLKQLEIESSDLIECSYSDLLIAKDSVQ